MYNNTIRNLFKSMHWVLPAALLTIATGLQWSGLEPLLRYDRALIRQGEWWRLLTGNLVHLGWNHFLLDGAALILLWLLFGYSYRLWQWLSVIIFTMLSVGVGLYLFNPHLAWYVGLSGLLHGIYAAGLVAVAREDKRQAALYGLLLTGKLVWEQLHGPAAATGALIGGAVVVDAHLYGSVAGLATGLLFTFVRSPENNYAARH